MWNKIKSKGKSKHTWAEEGTSRHISIFSPSYTYERKWIVSTPSLTTHALRFYDQFDTENEAIEFAEAWIDKHEKRLKEVV